MLRLLIKTPKPYLQDKKLIWTYSLSMLNSFKKELKNTVDYTKIKIRYNYLVDNNVLQFNNPTNKLSYKTIILNLISLFHIMYINTNNEQYVTCIYLNSSIIIPNSNMSYFHFLNFIQYGNFDIPPYPWIKISWNTVKEQFKKG
jgi:hypothetical protein